MSGEGKDGRGSMAPALGAVVRKLADSRDGQVFLRWCMAECGVFRQGFPRDDRATAWEAGRRAFGLQILELCVNEKCADILLSKETA
ncbi:MAG: hypothetical protein J1E80_09655 [Desulfovibrionaceae bacterium]|nr:hypothetical protein [Desulfovibrionaceae bacterium]